MTNWRETIDCRVGEHIYLYNIYIRPNCNLQNIHYKIK